MRARGALLERQLAAVNHARLVPLMAGSAQSRRQHAVSRARHAAPNSTALPGAKPGPDTDRLSSTPSTWHVDSPRTWRTASTTLPKPWM